MKKLIFITFLFFCANNLFAQISNFLWSKQIGGIGGDRGASITVDANGNVYTTGYFSSTADFDPGPGSHTMTSAGSYDIFISKFDVAGNFIWAKQMGGANVDYGNSITVDVNGYVYVTGTYDVVTTFSGDIIVSKLDPAGNFIWTRQMGGPSSDESYAIAVDINGNVYTSGIFLGTADFDPGPLTYNLTHFGFSDIFISKLDASGNFVWAKQLGGTDYDYSNSIAVDATGNVYTTGMFNGTADFNPNAGMDNLISVGVSDIFISKLDASGNFVWAKQFGSTSFDIGNSITLDATGNIYTTGYFGGIADFDPGAGTYNLNTIGIYDIFISKLDNSGNFVWAKQIGGTGIEEGKSIAVDANNNVYITGYFNNTCDFDPSPGAYSLVSAGDADIFCLKLNAFGNLIWAKQIGGAVSEYSNSITVGANSKLYITGFFTGTVDFNPDSGVSNMTTLGDNDVFVVKLGTQLQTEWTAQSSGTAIHLLDVHFTDFQTGWAVGGNPENIIHTTDGGQNWLVQASGITTGFLRGVDFADNQKGWVVGDFGKISYTIDGGQNWTAQNSGLTSNLNGVDFTDSQNGWAVSGFQNLAGIIIHTTDAGQNWIEQSSGTSNTLLAVHFIDSQNGWVVGANGTILHTSNGGQNWITQSSGTTAPLYGVHFTDNQHGWATSLNGNIFRTTNGGQNWSVISSGNPNNLIGVHFTDNLHGWVVGENGTILKTINGGLSWVVQSALTTNHLNSVFFTAGHHGWAVGHNGTILGSFQSTPYQLPYVPAQNAIKLNGNQITIADPIQLGTGTYSYTHNDFKIPSINGALNFTRFYNSLNNNVPGPLGYGWSHTYNYSLVNKQDTAWDIHYPDGHVSTFIPMNNLGQSFPVFSGTFDSLQKNNNNSFSLFTKEKQHYHFDSIGRLDSIIDLNNNITKLHYTGNTLDSIVAPGGRSLIITSSGNKITSVKDPLNRICSYTYDANNNLTAVIDANNGTATFTYDTAHKMLIAKNPLNNTIVDNTYDGSAKVISQKDAYNQVTSIVYNSPTPGDATVTNPDNSQIIAHHDAFIRKTSEKDELNFIKSYTYDANSNENGFTNENNQSERRFFDTRGNLLIDTLPGNKITNITYNNFNSPVQVTDAKGFIKTFYYNSVTNNLDSIRYPDNSMQAYYYNGLGQVIQSVDGIGHTTTYTYSPSGDLLSTQTAAGIKLFAYDAAGRKVSSTDENGHTTNYVYDNNDNIITITDALGLTTVNTYDANNQLLTVKDKKGFVTTYTYDNKGRKISSTNPKGAVTAYTYDVRDNLISVTDPNSNTVTYTYDAKGRKTSSTNALGTTQYQYDGVGNLLKIIDPTNKTTEYSYTATNKKQSHKDGLSNTTIYAYDLNDNLTSVTDPLNRITLNGYDVLNRLVAVTDAVNKTTTVTYDNNGNKKTVVDPNGHTQSYNYDAVNRLINYQDAAGNNYAYSYDSAGNNITLTKPTGTIGKVFDAANRVLTVNNSTGNNYIFTYDNNDNIITIGNNIGTTTMVYDSLNQLKQYQDPYNKTVSFTYDAAGNKTSIIYPGNKTVLYTFDNANNLKTVTDWLSHTFTYTYDSAGRTKQLLYPNGVKCGYGFDNAGSLISKINRSGTNAIISGSTFTLDAVGNRIAEQRLAQAPTALPSLSRAYIYANDDRMLSDSVWNYANDSSGNRTAETNGTDTASYTFSVDNLLNALVDTAGTNSTYSYDVLGHRIAKVTGSNSNKYVLDISGSLSQVLQITDAGGVVKSNYVYGLGLLERIDAADSVLYYHFDAQHNTTLLTGQDSAIKDTYTYDPFGTMLTHSGTTTQPFTFLGEYGVEQESPGLYYARARYYDAVNGRFLSKDAFDYNLNNPQTINRYVYATNNPVSIFDYTGLYGEQDNIGNTGSKDAWGLPSNWIDFADVSQTLLDAFNFKNKWANAGVKDFGQLIGLYNLYNNANISLTSFKNGEIGITELLADLGLSVFDIYSESGSLYDYKYEVQKTTDDYVNGKIDFLTADVNLVNSGLKVLVPGYGFTYKYITPKIMNGYMNSINYLGDQLYKHTGIFK